VLLLPLRPDLTSPLLPRAARPALVALVATLSPPAPVVGYVCAMLVGMAADCAATRSLALRPKPAAA
jgi:hypothetical protein